MPFNVQKSVLLYLQNLERNQYRIGELIPEHLAIKNEYFPVIAARSP